MAEVVKWSIGATALTTSRPMRKGTLSDCIKWVIGLPEADQRVAHILIQEQPEIEEARLGIVEIKALRERSDFPT